MIGIFVDFKVKRNINYESEKKKNTSYQEVLTNEFKELSEINKATRN